MERINMENENKNIIRSHHDGDGICSGYFTSFKYPYRIEIWDGNFGDTTGMKKGDIMTDMHPTGDWDGIVIDHHLGKGYPLAHKYKLIYDTVPASLIAWREFKEDIPESEWWKLAIGLKGDGQPELLPYEVFQSCPQLLLKYETSMSDKKSYGKYYSMYDYVFHHLSAPVNAFLRMKDSDGAIKLISESKQPFDIIYSDEANNARSKVNSEFLKIVRNHRTYQFADGKLGLIVFYSKFRMSGYIASALHSSIGVNSLIAINRATNRGSLRGVLADYWEGRLKPLEYLEIGGHSGFKGVTLRKVNTEAFINDLTEMLQ